MSLTDELAKTLEELTQVSDKYDNLWNKLFVELSKYLSFINDKSFSVQDKIIYYKDEDRDLSKTLNIIFSLSSKYKLKKPDPIACVIIKSNYDDKFLKKIISEFCIANNLDMQIVDE